MEKGTPGGKLGAAKAETAGRASGLAAPAQAAALPYDEMLDGRGAVRPHYAALAARIETLSAEELAERQKTLERFFAAVRAIRLQPGGSVQVWRTEERVWTTRSYSATGTLRNGNTFRFDGWHSAIW